jgi:cell division protein ZapA
MARPKDRLIQVEIYGQRYSLRAEDEAEAGYVEQLAAHVDKKMRELAASTPTVDSFKVAVLAAVNIADEYFQERQRWQSVEGQVREKAEKLGTLLDETLRTR